MRVLQWLYQALILCCIGIALSSCFVLRTPSAFKSRLRAVVDKKIVIPTIAREYILPGKVEVANGKYIVPGDYITHSDYGIGRYLGLRSVPVHSRPEFRENSIRVDVIDIEYSDGIITWYVKFAQRDLWRFRSGLGGQDQELSSIIDTAKWVQRQKLAMDDAEAYVLDDCHCVKFIICCLGWLWI